MPSLQRSLLATPPREILFISFCILLLLQYFTPQFLSFGVPIPARNTTENDLKSKHSSASTVSIPSVLPSGSKVLQTLLAFILLFSRAVFVLTITTMIAWAKLMIKRENADHILPTEPITSLQGTLSDLSHSASSSSRVEDRRKNAAAALDAIGRFWEQAALEAATKLQHASTQSHNSRLVQQHRTVLPTNVERRDQLSYLKSTVKSSLLEDIEEEEEVCGYPPDLFVDGTPTCFLCSICKQVARKPYAIPCGHLFCGSCLRQVHPRSCPRCCSSFIPPMLLRPSSSVIRITESLRVRCSNYQRGCTFVEAIGINDRNIRSHAQMCTFAAITASGQGNASLQRTSTSNGASSDLV